jgi:DnaJ-class molecular chaperone
VEILALALIAGGVGYVVSLKLHPYRPCPSCRRTGESRGQWFRGTFGVCRRCKGTGQVERLGVRFFKS